MRGLLLATLLVYACGAQQPVSGAGPAATASAAPTLTPSPSGPAVITNAPPGAARTNPPQAASWPRCHTKDLLLSVGGQLAAAGTVVDTFQLVDLTAPCTLYGFVSVTLRSPLGQLPIPVVRAGGIFSGRSRTSLLHLQVGGRASFQLAFSDVPRLVTPCVPADELVITPPQETASLNVVIYLAPCGSEVDVSPLVAA